MRITDALKPVTDAPATAGMSLESATYKDGKIHATLSTEVPKATGKPGSGPEYPPEGYRLIASAVPGSTVPSSRLPGDAFWTDQHVFLAGFGWCDYRTVRRNIETLRGAKIIAVAVPIASKPEPVKLTDQEKIVGWRGPSGFRLQTFQNREVQCAVCKKTIKAGERLARWRSKFPEVGDQDHVVGHPGNEENHSHAHVDCLFHLSQGVVYPRSVRGLDYHEDDVPKWLWSKRNKWHEQQ